MRRRLITWVCGIAVTVILLAIILQAWFGLARLINKKEIAENLKFYKLLYMSSPNKDVSFEHRPNVEFDFHSIIKPDYVMHIKTNSLGLREDTDIPFPKPKDTIRIIGLGDSVTFGSSVDNHETMLRWLERIGQEKGIKVQTLNYGIGSSNPMHGYYYFIYKKGLDYHPDILILGFCTNDFYIGYRIFDEELGNWKYSSEKEKVLKKGILAKLVIVRVIRQAPDAIKNFLLQFGLFRKLYNFAYSRIHRKEVISLECVNKTKFWIGKIREVANENNIRFIVFVFPERRQIDFLLKGIKVSLEPQEKIARVCRELGIKIYDPTHDIVAESRKNKYAMEQVFFDDIHFYKTGERILGGLLFDFLLKNGYLAENRLPARYN